MLNCYSFTEEFPRGRDDWTYRFPEVPRKLKEFSTKGFSIVIFTNQRGIEKGHTSEADIVGKIHDISVQIGVPITAFIAAKDNHYAKPAIGMWEFLKSNFCGVTLNLKESFFVGDAAGRFATQGRPKDFSCSDRKFAHNIGLQFFTETEFFLHDGKPAGEKFSWDGLSPQKLKEFATMTRPANVHYAKPSQELVILCGPPASGKSTFAKTYFVPHGYAWVNRDTFKTMEKCLKFARESLSSGKSIVIDNTNPGTEARKVFINLANELKVDVRCCIFRTDLDLAKHLNRLREKMTKGSVPHIPEVAYRFFKSKFEEPSLGEGFSSIVNIPFYPNFDEEDSELFLQLV